MDEAANKAAEYGFKESPDVIKEGMNAFAELVIKLTIDGYKIKIPHLNIKIVVYDENDGSETEFPLALLNSNPVFVQMLEGPFSVVFEPAGKGGGFMDRALDEATGLINDCLTPGKLLTVHGVGLKIEPGDADNADVGLTFMNITNGRNTPADTVVVNKRSALKVVIPPNLTFGVYILRLVTYSRLKGFGPLLKEPRKIVSDFTLSVNG